MNVKEFMVYVIGIIAVTAIIIFFIGACHIGIQHTRELKTVCIKAHGNWNNGNCNFYESSR